MKSKLVLLEASSMSVLIPALLPLGPQPRFYFVLLPLSPTLPVDVACASSTERRKPKTGGILLKGVSQQPDINNLVYAEQRANPWDSVVSLGCVRTPQCVLQHLPYVCSAYLHVSRLLFLPLTIHV